MHAQNWVVFPNEQLLGVTPDTSLGAVKKSSAQCAHQLDEDGLRLRLSHIFELITTIKCCYNIIEVLCFNALLRRVTK